MATQQDYTPPPPGTPPEHVVDFNYFRPEGMDAGEDVYQALGHLHEGGKPDILWSTRDGGYWIISRSDDVRWVRDEPILFSHDEFNIPRGLFNVVLPPINVDPPYHARFRMLLNPSFRPGKIKEVQEKARATAIRLIEGFQPNGKCEFISEFARIMPVEVFLHLLDLPTDRRDEYVSWAVDFINAQDVEVKNSATAKVVEFLNGVLNDREANPRDDVFTRIVGWRKSPHFQGEQEVMGMAMGIFLGGLDTVSNMLAFTIRHLATHPEHRRRLIAEPELIPNAAEEYIRRHPLSMTARLLKDDVERKGVTLRKGDLALICDPLSGIDERAYPNAREIDFDRDTSVHDTFGNGVHRCIGEHLARMEVRLFLEEWLKRIPEFSLDPEKPVVTSSGIIIGIQQLGLKWPT